MSDRTSEWISVKDRLPDKGIPVLCCLKRFDEMRPYVGIYYCDVRRHESLPWVPHWQEYDALAQNQKFWGQVTPTHWMPLPEPPHV